MSLLKTKEEVSIHCDGNEILDAECGEREKLGVETFEEAEVPEEWTESSQEEGLHLCPDCSEKAQNESDYQITKVGTQVAHDTSRAKVEEEKYDIEMAHSDYFIRNIEKEEFVIHIAEVGYGFQTSGYKPMTDESAYQLGWQTMQTIINNMAGGHQRMVYDLGILLISSLDLEAEDSPLKDEDVPEDLKRLRKEVREEGFDNVMNKYWNINDESPKSPTIRTENQRIDELEDEE